MLSHQQIFELEKKYTPQYVAEWVTLYREVHRIEKGRPCPYSTSRIAFNRNHPDFVKMRKSRMEIHNRKNRWIRAYKRLNSCTEKDAEQAYLDQLGY